MHLALLDHKASAVTIAKQFSVHPRTLSRRLKDAATSFQEIVAQYRFDIAKQLLENSSLDINQIVLFLDYADARAFGRAIKGWSGVTPATRREENMCAFDRYSTK